MSLLRGGSSVGQGTLNRFFAAQAVGFHSWWHPRYCCVPEYCPPKGYRLHLDHYRPRGLLGVVLLWTSCAITRCREIMTPQLSIVKTRFAKASLRPRCARHRSWGATCLFPNRRAGTLSYPMLAWDTHRPNGCFGHSATQFTRRIVEQHSWSCRTPIHFRPPPNSRCFTSRLPTV